MRLGRTVLKAGILATLVAGCANVDRGGERYSVADSAGIRIVESAAPRFGDPWVVASDATLVIRSDFGEPDHFLYGARYAINLADGTLVLGNMGTQELFFFSSEGLLLQVMGGQGDGPGEFQNVFGLHRCENDSLIVEEVSRLSVIDGAARRFSRTVPIVGHLADGRAGISGVRSDCSAALLADSRYVPPTPGTGLYVQPMTLYWANLASGARDTLGTFPAVEAFPWMMRGQLLGVRTPYGRDAVWAVHPDGVLVGLAEEASYEIRTDGGRVKQIVRWKSSPSILSDDEWAYYERERSDYLRNNPDVRDVEAPPDHFPRPERKPAYSRAIVDVVGRVWIRAYGLYGAYGPEPSSQWSVFSVDGEWLAEARMPDGLEVLAITATSIIGRVVDDLDVESIRVHALHRVGRTPS